MIFEHNPATVRWSVSATRTSDFFISGDVRKITASDFCDIVILRGDCRDANRISIFLPISNQFWTLGITVAAFNVIPMDASAMCGRAI
jgi:hypothetical protein